MKTLFTLLCCLSFASPALLASPAIVGHSGLKGQSLDADSAKAVLLGKRATLGDTRVIIVIAKAGANQDALLQTVAGMGTSQFQTLWRRLFMTGGGSAPRVVDTEEDVLKLVAATPGAIGFVDSGSAGDNPVLFTK